jgi:glucose-6-phosphate dehydrogenase assembly protein OpcA
VVGWLARRLRWECRLAVLEAAAGIAPSKTVESSITTEMMERRLGPRRAPD